MAKIAYAAIVDGIRGTIGGVTFSANKAGAYVKRYSRPRLNQTDNQLSNLVVLGVRAAAWQDLSAAQRTAWNNWADDPAQALVDAFGDDYFISGFAWFVRFNSWRHTQGLDIREDVPTDTEPAAPTIDALVVDSTEVFPNSRVTVEFPLNEFQNLGFVCGLSRRPNPGNQTPFSSPALFANEPPTGVDSNSFGNFAIEQYGEITPGTQWIAEVYTQSAQGYRSAPTQVQDTAS